MSKDPFEELFGRSVEQLSEPADQPDRGESASGEPLPATAPLPAARAASGMGSPTTDPAPDRSSRAKPWVIVGLVALVAVGISFFVLQYASNGQADGDTAAQNSATSETTQSAPATEDTVTGTDTDDDSDADEKDEDAAPEVEVGPTNTLPIGPWNATSELSQRFGSTYFNIPDGTNLTLTSDLLNSFPDSCADMREAWGATRNKDGSYEIRKPAESCADAPELYEEVWGLTQAWVDTIKEQ